MFYSYSSDEVRALCNAGSRVVLKDESQVRDHCALLAMTWFRDIYLRARCATGREYVRARRTYPSININPNTGDVWISVREKTELVPSVNYREQRRVFGLR